MIPYYQESKYVCKGASVGMNSKTMLIFNGYQLRYHAPDFFIQEVHMVSSFKKKRSVAKTRV